MGWSDFSCFGNKDASTPHIDRLAQEGLRFEQFYVNSPICSPSRVAISTGQYPLKWGITSYLAARDLNQQRGLRQWLDPNAPMLARSLQKAGYATGHFGKWHMGGQRDVTEAPEITKYGFDISLTNFEGMGAKLLPKTMKPGWDKPGRIWQDAEILGGPTIWEMRSKITAGFTQSALSYIRKVKGENKPFYVNIWPDDVHEPFWPSVENYKGKRRDLYLAVLEEMDTQLGPLFDFVRNDKDLKDNTLIMICSDNGPARGAGQAGPYKGYKTFLYEGGIRSPLIVWGPGLMNKEVIGTINKDSIFSAIDLVPSVLDLCKVSNSSATKLDGENIRPTLLGESKASRQKSLFFCRPPDRKSFYGVQSLPDLAIRKGNYKLLCDYDGQKAELYDLSKDVSESRDISSQHLELTKSMVSEVTTWYKNNNNLHVQ